MKFGICWVWIISMVLLLFNGCSSTLEYKAGLYTKSVEGTFTTIKDQVGKQPFILVLDYHRTLIETSEGYLNTVTAFLVYPDENGKYRAPYSTDTVKLELTYYAHESHITVQAFPRSLGVGSYKFDVKLDEDLNWQNSYYLTIKPTLVEYITEKRFLMNQLDKHFIGEWLSAADEKF